MWIWCCRGMISVKLSSIQKLYGVPWSDLWSKIKLVFLFSDVKKAVIQTIFPKGWGVNINIVLNVNVSYLYYCKLLNKILFCKGKRDWMFRGLLWIEQISPEHQGYSFFFDLVRVNMPFVTPRHWLLSSLAWKCKNSRGGFLPGDGGWGGGSILA